MSTKEQLRANCMALTGTMETSSKAPACYAVSVGNFDGMGMSFGVLQWNLGKGTLQPILTKMLVDYAPTAERVLSASGYNVINNMLKKDKAAQVAWGDSITDPTTKKLKETWKKRFTSLGLTPECQAIQIQQAEWYYKQAENWFKLYGFWSERAYALLFDIAVQLGSMVGHKELLTTTFTFADTISPDDLEVKRMVVLVEERLKSVPEKWRSVVRDRKMAIATGSGTIYGTLKIKADEFGIRLVKAEI